MTVAKLKIKPDCRDRKLFPQVSKKQFKIRNIENFGLKTRFLFSYLINFNRHSSGIKKPKFWQWLFFGSHSSGIKKPKFQQWFFLADKAVVSKNRNFGNGFFGRIAVVSKNRNYCNGFFWQIQQWYQKTEILAMVFFFGRHSSGIKTSKFWQFFFFFCRYSSGIKKPKLWQWVFFICISRVIIETLIHSQ